MAGTLYSLPTINHPPQSQATVAGLDPSIPSSLPTQRGHGGSSSSSREHPVDSPVLPPRRPRVPAVLRRRRVRARAAGAPAPAAGQAGAVRGGQADLVVGAPRVPAVRPAQLRAQLRLRRRRRRRGQPLLQLHLLLPLRAPSAVRRRRRTHRPRHGPANRRQPLAPLISAVSPPLLVGFFPFPPQPLEAGKATSFLSKKKETLSG